MWSLRFFLKNVVGCHIWKCVKLCIQVLGYVLYTAVMLSKFYKITSLEKNFFLYEIETSNTASLHRIL